MYNRLSLESEMQRDRRRNVPAARHTHNIHLVGTPDSMISMPEEESGRSKSVLANYFQSLNMMWPFKPKLRFRYLQ